MRFLLIGGTRFLGHHLTNRLLARGHHLTLLHRGTTPSAFSGRVEEILGDRTRSGALAGLVRGRRFDGVVDLCAYRPEETREAAEAHLGSAGRFVHVSTGAVYLVRRDVPRPSREEDFDGPTIPRPEEDPGEWEYGMAKRGCEEALAQAGRAGFPWNAVRLPILHGPRDHTLRLCAYIRRVADGGPVLLPDGGRAPIRHLFVGDAAEALAGLLEGRGGPGKAYNVAMEEDDWTLRRLVLEVFAAAGREPRIVDVAPEDLTGAGLPRMISPLTTRWASFLDPGEAIRELGFRSTPVREWVRATVDWFLREHDGGPPPGYDARAREIELALRLGAEQRSG